MATEIPLDRIVVLSWGDHPCPPTHLRDQLSGLDCEVVVRDADDLADCDGAVTVYTTTSFWRLSTGFTPSGRGTTISP